MLNFLTSEIQHVGGQDADACCRKIASNCFYLKRTLWKCKSFRMGSPPMLTFLPLKYVSPLCERPNHQFVTSSTSDLQTTLLKRRVAIPGSTMILESFFDLAMGWEVELQTYLPIGEEIVVFHKSAVFSLHTLLVSCTRPASSSTALMMMLMMSHKIFWISAALESNPHHSNESLAQTHSKHTIFLGRQGQG